jgi:deoxycytidine triphosphate deaminase
MAVLSSTDLRRMYPESPFIGPASIDLHLGNSLLMWPHWVKRDPRRDQSKRWIEVSTQRVWEDDELLLFGEPGNPLNFSAWVLHPGRRYLAATRERIKIRPDVAGEITARSTWGRDGLAVICGPAGWIDPGYEGHPTLELSVVGSELVLWPGASVAQLILHRLETPCDQEYAGRYQCDSQPTPARMLTEVTR